MRLDGRGVCCRGMDPVKTFTNDTHIKTNTKIGLNSKEGDFIEIKNLKWT